MNIPRIEGFDITTWVRENSTSVTWRARQKSLDRPVLLAIAKPDIESERREAFVRNARLVARVNLPGLAGVYDVAETSDGLPYAILEDFDGQSLRDLLASSGGQLSQKRLLPIARAIAETLEAAWNGHRFVHRNLKPEELFLLADGSIHIAGFTSCTYVGDDGLLADRSGEIVGTVTYMPPEQAAVQPTVDMRADMYTLGAVLYHLATGHVPFGEYANDPQRLLAMIDVAGLPPPRTLNPALSAGFEAVLARLLMKDPQNRYTSWDGLLQDLDSLAIGEPPAIALEFVPQGRTTFVPEKEPPKSLLSPAPQLPVPPQPSVSPAVGNAKPESILERIRRRERAEARGRVSPLLWLLLLAALGALAVWRWNHPDVEPTAETIAALLAEQLEPQSEAEDDPPAEGDEFIPFSQP